MQCSWENEAIRVKDPQVSLIVEELKKFEQKSSTQQCSALLEMPNSVLNFVETGALCTLQKPPPEEKRLSWHKRWSETVPGTTNCQGEML